jgi:hypothetical protein
MKHTIRQNMESLRTLFRDTSGAEIAEAAVILPLLFMLLFGIMWFARAFNIYTTVNHAAREAALVAAAPTCASCGNVFPNQTYIRNNVVDPILNASHVNPSQVQNFNLLPNVILNPGSPLQERGTVVSFDYPYNFRLNGVTCCPLALSPITTGIIINAKGQAREEN